MTTEKNDLIKLIGVPAYIRLVLEQHQLKFFLFMFAITVLGVFVSW